MSAQGIEHRRSSVSVGADHETPPLRRCAGPVIGYRRGAAITLPSDRACLGKILTGLAGIVRTDRAGRDAVVEIIGPEGTVAEETVVGNGCIPAGTRLEALVDTQIHWADSEAVLRAGTQAVSIAVMSVLAARTLLLNDLWCRRRWQTRSQQIAQLILDLATVGAETEALSGRVRLSQWDIARIAGTDRSAVSVNCRNFRSREWLTIDQNGLTIVATDALRSFAAAGVAEVNAVDGTRDRLLKSQRRLSALLGLVATG